VRRGGGCVCFVSTALHSSMWDALHIRCAMGCYAMYVDGGLWWWGGVDVQSEIGACIRRCRMGQISLWWCGASRFLVSYGVSAAVIGHVCPAARRAC
jgi:hypothetical protein